MILDFLVKVGATLIGVTLAGLFAYHRYRIEQNEKKETVVAYIFGELLSIYEHYSYVAYETRKEAASEHDFVLYMRMSKAGPLSSATRASELGNLTAEQIGDLFQLNVRVRNTDLILDRVIESRQELTNDIRAAILERTDLCKTSAELLINSISEHRHELKNMFIDLKIRLESIKPQES